MNAIRAVNFRDKKAIQSGLTLDCLFYLEIFSSFSGVPNGN